MTAYLIATIDVHDAEGYEAYKSTVPALIENHGGRYIVRGGERDDVEGDWPSGRVVVLEFPHWESANASADDPAYEPVRQSANPRPHPISGSSRVSRAAPMQRASTPTSSAGFA